MNKKIFIAAYVFIGVLINPGLRAQQLTLPPVISTGNSFHTMMTATSLKIKQPALHLTALQQQGESGLKLRNTGIGLTAFGVACITAGIVMVNAADGVTYYHAESNSNGYSEEEGSFSGAMGLIGIVGGTAAVIGGGTMWYFGQKKLQKQRKAASLNFTPTSASLVYHF